MSRRSAVRVGGECAALDQRASYLRSFRDRVQPPASRHGPWSSPARLTMGHPKAGPPAIGSPGAQSRSAGGPACLRGDPLVWKLLELLAAAESDPERRGPSLLRTSDELREVLDAPGMPVDAGALLADLGILEPETE